MAILAECDICGNQHRVKDGLAGSSIHCKECGVQFTVPRNQLITPKAFVEEGGRLRQRPTAPPGKHWAWVVVGSVTVLVGLALGGVVWVLVLLNSPAPKGSTCHLNRPIHSQRGLPQ